MESLIKGIEVAEEFNTKILLHPSDPPVPVGEVLGLMRNGDIYCHVYNDQGFTVLENGEVCDAAWKARERGVLFDLAHGGRNFSWEVAEKAFKEGFYPDLISSDTTTKTWNYKPIYNLPNVMSKALFLGMGISDVIRCVTDNAAEAMNMGGEWGTLTAGTCADIAILKLKEGHYPLVDANGMVREAKHLLVPQCTIVDGQMLYRNAEF
jgi:dihydroorotase